MIKLDAKFKGEKLNAFVQELKSMKAELKVGFYDGSTYADTGVKVAQVAYYNEYGIGGNPPRPFMKRTIDKNKTLYIMAARRVLKAMGCNPRGLARAYQGMGTKMRTDIIKAIKAWNPNDPRPNKQATILRKMRRGRTGKNQVAIDPYAVLIDTGTMINSIMFKIEDK